MRGTAHWEGEKFVNDYEETIGGKETRWRDTFEFAVGVLEDNLPENCALAVEGFLHLQTEPAGAKAVHPVQGFHAFFAECVVARRAHRFVLSGTIVGD